METSLESRLRAAARRVTEAIRREPTRQAIDRAMLLEMANHSDDRTFCRELNAMRPMFRAKLEGQRQDAPEPGEP